MKKVLRIMGKVVLAILAVLLLIAIILFIRNKIQEKKPWLPDDYYSNFTTDSPLEQKYTLRGSFETAHSVYDSDNKNIGKIHVYFPRELESNDKIYPLIMVVNGSNTRALNYLPFFDRLASWGFIVVGTDDPQAGTGETTSIALDFILNLGSTDVLSGKVDRDRIGIAGYSQGGAGALGASQNYGNSKPDERIPAYGALRRDPGLHAARRRTDQRRLVPAARETDDSAYAAARPECRPH